MKTLLLLFFALTSLVESSAQANRPSPVGKPFPAQEFVTIDGERITPQMLAGKVVHYNFWFLGCGPCRKEIPGLVALQEKYAGNDDVIFIAIGFDAPKKIRTFAAKQGWRFKMVALEEEDFWDFQRQVCGSMGCPANIFVDRSGTISGAAFGAPYEGTTAWVIENLSPAIDKALGSK